MFERSRPSILHYKFELYFNVIKIITQVRGKISNQALDWLFLRFLPFRPDRAWALVSLSSSWICLTWPWAQARVVTLVCFIQTPFRPISCLSTSLHPIRQNHETSSDAFQRFWKKKSIPRSEVLCPSSTQLFGVQCLFEASLCSESKSAFQWLGKYWYVKRRASKWMTLNEQNVPIRHWMLLCSTL